jgi:HAD superfamily hydrolase (TIGR01490 family)
LGGDKHPKVAAIFDLDGTLYSGHITLGIAQHHRTNRVNRIPLYLYMTLHMPLWGLLKLGLITETTSRQIWAGNLGWVVRGLTTDNARQAFAWISENYVLPRLYGELMEMLGYHHSAGHRVILVSGTFTPLLAQIGGHLGLEEVVGTPLVVKNARYTGAYEPPVCQGRHKVTRLEQYLKHTGDILWSESFAYADSFTDLPLLEHVGHPTAVYPDPKLAAHAREKGWDIIGHP